MTPQSKSAAWAVLIILGMGLVAAMPVILSVLATYGAFDSLMTRYWP